MHFAFGYQRLAVGSRPAPAAQRAAVKAWCGELRPQGVCPVAIPKIKVRRFQYD